MLQEKTVRTDTKAGRAAPVSVCNVPISESEASMTRGGALLLVLPVSMLTLFWAIAFFLSPTQTTSTYENRKLAAFPATGELRAFPRDFETYFTDQFPFRDQWVTAYTGLQLWQHQTYVRNNVICGDWLMSKEYPAEASQMSAAAQKVNALQKADGRPIYYLSVPRKSYALSDLYPDPAMAHTENLPIFLGQLDRSIHVVNASKAMALLSREQRESMFYKTDFHWNARGAFYAWKQLVNAMVEAGDLPETARVDDQDYPETTVTGKRYLGDLNRQISYLFDVNEPIVYVRYRAALPVVYTRLIDGVMTEVPEHEIFAADLDKDELNYIGAYTANMAYYRVDSPESLTDRKVLVIRDSMQSPTTPLFAAVFRSTEFLDVRYLTDKTVKDYLAESDADLVVMFYNSANLTGEMYEFE